ncbi:Uncharacterized protein Adt_18563 [Abeliophyllum distichum]|uniref:Uncharacterized protein n=1 Tax=Abeliophyllum distichum TaxID=126358 RepID=A0ABD1TK35_9LAMI
MHRDVQNLLNVDLSEYEMEFRFLFLKNTQFSVQLVKVILNMELQWLINLNQRHHYPLCITLVMKDIPENDHETVDDQRDVNEVDPNMHDFLGHNGDSSRGRCRCPGAKCYRWIP